MGLVTIPNRPAGTDQRSIEAILADFDAITDQVNGNIDMTNIVTGIVLELATTGTRRKVSYGTTQISFPGGSSNATTLTIPHGLGATPTWYNAMPEVGIGIPIFLFGTTPATATDIYISGNTPGGTPSAGPFCFIHWVAIG